MSFFKEFKEDLSQAVNELMPGDDSLSDETMQDSDLMVDTLEDDVDVASELSKLDGLLEKVSENVEAEANKAFEQAKEEQEELPLVDAEITEQEEEKENDDMDDILPELELPEDLFEKDTEEEIAVESDVTEEPVWDESFEKEETDAVEETEVLPFEETVESLDEEEITDADEISENSEDFLADILPEEPVSEDAVSEILEENDAKSDENIEETVIEERVIEETETETTEEMAFDTAEETDSVWKDNEEEKDMSKKTDDVLAEVESTETEMETTMEAEMEETVVNNGEVTDETAVITAGTKIQGNISSTGSVDVQGEIEGDVTCNGKLTVTGTVKGNSSTSEFFADSAKIEGEVVSTGTVKIGLGSVVIGNLKATSAVIAGAIKGDIDVQGPVVVDTSAVVVGNIKSRSVQINNGAVIEGFCSQCYAEIDMDNLFGEKKGK